MIRWRTVWTECRRWAVLGGAIAFIHCVIGLALLQMYREAFLTWDLPTAEPQRFLLDIVLAYPILRLKVFPPFIPDFLWGLVLQSLFMGVLGAVTIRGMAGDRRKYPLLPFLCLLPIRVIFMALVAIAVYAVVSFPASIGRERRYTSARLSTLATKKGLLSKFIHVPPTARQVEFRLLISTGLGPSLYSYNIAMQMDPSEIDRWRRIRYGDFLRRDLHVGEHPSSTYAFLDRAQWKLTTEPEVFSDRWGYNSIYIYHKEGIVLLDLGSD